MDLWPCCFWQTYWMESMFSSTCVLLFNFHMMLDQTVDHVNFLIPCLVSKTETHGQHDVTVFHLLSSISLRSYSIWKVKGAERGFGKGDLKFSLCSPHLKIMKNKFYLRMMPSYHACSYPKQWSMISGRLLPINYLCKVSISQWNT